MSARPILSLRLVPKPERQIVVEPEPFGVGYDVRVLPPPDGPGHDCEHSEYLKARQYADRLSKATGWPVSDLCRHGGDVG